MSGDDRKQSQNEARKGVGSVLVRLARLAALVLAVATAHAGGEGAEPGRETSGIPLDEFLKLSEVVAEALISDCDPETFYCVVYTGSLGTGREVVWGEPVRLRYSAWGVPDIAQVTARSLWEFDLTRAPVRDRSMLLTPGEERLVGLEMVLRPHLGESVRVGAVFWAVIPPEIAGALKDGLAAIPPSGGMATRVEILP